MSLVARGGEGGQKGGHPGDRYLVNELTPPPVLAGSPLLWAVI